MRRNSYIPTVFHCSEIAGMAQLCKILFVRERYWTPEHYVKLNRLTVQTTWAACRNNLPFAAVRNTMALSSRIAGCGIPLTLRSSSSAMAGRDHRFRRVVRRNAGDAPYREEPPVKQSKSVVQTRIVSNAVRVAYTEKVYPAYFTGQFAITNVRFKPFNTSISEQMK